MRRIEGSIITDIPKSVVLKRYRTRKYSLIILISLSALGFAYFALGILIFFWDLKPGIGVLFIFLFLTLIVIDIFLIKYLMKINKKIKIIQGKNENAK
ncbi:MAG: hypothetical protein HGN29_15135 [Asgard group archaeon]|nr:hypothetical protein [Asgard group archaeon]